MTELDAILRTIREVESSLDRRYARAQGALIMVWGLVGASIFAFYQLVALDPAPYVAALGGALSWVWLAPVAIGYAASAVVGARFGSSVESPRDRRLALLPGSVVTLLAVGLLLLGREDLIEGALTLAAGATTLGVCGRGATPFSRAGRAIGAGLAATGIALLVWPSPWASGIAAAAFGIGFLALGTVKYRSG